MKRVRFMQMAMLMAAMAFTACQNSDVDEVTSNVPEQDEIVLDMIHPHGAATRATETAFENSDKVGVYVTAADAALQLGGNEVNNALFTYNGSSWAASRKVYWNNGKHNVFAYYPYSETVNEWRITVSACRKIRVRRKIIRLAISSGHRLRMFRPRLHLSRCNLLISFPVSW